MIFELANDYAEVLEAMPEQHPRHRILKLLNEAIRRDAGFIAVHPYSFFQCLWNSCWWHDTPVAAAHYIPTGGAASVPLPPWRQPGLKLSSLLEKWREKRQATSSAFWIKSCRPQFPPLDSRQIMEWTTKSLSLIAYSSLTYSSDGEQIFAAEGNNVTAWEVSTGQKRGVFVGHTQPVTCICPSNDGRLIVTGSEDRTVRVWSTADWTQVAQFTNHSSSVNTVSISNDSKFVVSGSGDRLATSAGDTTVRVWNQQTQKQISVFHGHNTSATAVAFDPSTKCVVSGTDEGRICVWNRDTGDLIADLLDEVVELPDGPIPIADGIIVDLKFDQNGTEVISIDEDTTLMRWNARTGTAIRRFRVEVDNKYPVLCAKLFPEVNQCAISLWSTDVILANLSGNPSASRFTGTPCQIDSIAWSPDGRNIAGYCQDGKIRIWHRQSMLDDMKLNGHTENITCLAFSDDGQQIASGGFDERIMLWCPETGVLTKEIENTGMVGFLTFTHDGLGLVSVAFDTEIRLWDLKAGILVASSVKLTQRIKLLSVCPADRFVAALTEDGMIVLWNPSTPTPTSLQSIESEGVNYDSLCFSKDGRHLIASQGDKATEWDLEESDPHPIVSNEALSRADRELPEKYFLFPRDSVNCLLLEMSKGDTVAVFPAFFLISKSYPPDSRWAVANGRHVMILELVEEIVEDIETIEIIDSFPEFDPPNF